VRARRAAHGLAANDITICTGRFSWTSRRWR